MSPEASMSPAKKEKRRQPPDDHSPGDGAKKHAEAALLFLRHVNARPCEQYTQHEGSDSHDSDYLPRILMGPFVGCASDFFCPDRNRLLDIVVGFGNSLFHRLL